MTLEPQVAGGFRVRNHQRSLSFGTSEVAVMLILISAVSTISLILFAVATTPVYAESTSNAKALDGNLYVSSVNTNEIKRYSAESGTFINNFVSNANGGLLRPEGLVFGADGNLYVASTFSNEVKRYNGTTGAFMDNFVSVASGGVIEPTGLIFGPDGKLYVSSSGSNEIKRYNGTTGAFIDNFVAAESGGLGGPESLTFGPDGNLYVISQNTIEVKRYNGTTGAFIDNFVSYGSGGLSRAFGLVFGPDGNLYVCSAATNEIKRYNGTTGAFMDNFAPQEGGGLLRLDGPVGLTFGPDGNLYVINEGTSDVERYNGTTGTFIDNFVAFNRSGGLNGPGDLTFAVSKPLPPKHVSLEIRSVDLSGKPVEGVWTTISTSNGIILKTGYTPLTFTGAVGAKYLVSVANYDGKIFDHWADGGSNSASHTVTLSSNATTTMTAYYNLGHALRGFAPLTFPGTSGAPDLTVRALILKDNRPLRMSMIIDPQGSSKDESGRVTSTYRVYATDGYNNLTFDHWVDNGSKDRIRTVTIAENTTITAYYKTASVAFSSNRDGHYEIYVMNTDGRGQARLTFFTSVDNTNPIWSPDGTKIAFVSSDKITANSQIYIMNGDGSGLMNLSNNSTSKDTSPSWSPDGKKIAFVRGGEKRGDTIITNGQIYVMNSTDGSGKTRIGEGFYPSWLPDGTKLSFISTNNFHYLINLANSGGSNGMPAQIDTGTFGRIGNPAWSPDGTKVAYEVDETFHLPVVSIEVRDVNGTIIDRLPFTPPSLGSGNGADKTPKWSPDGSEIAYSTFTFIGNPAPNNLPKGGIFVAKSGNLTAVTRLTDNSTDSTPVWSPDGKKIAFASQRDNNAEIYSIDTNGTGLTRLTNNAAADIEPDWGRQPSSSPASVPHQGRLTVKTVDMTRLPVTGVWTTIQGVDGTLLKSGFTPLTFIGGTGTSYKITVANYDGKIFQHWLDGNNSTSNRRIVSPAADNTTILTALYDTGNSLRGFTPVTYSGSANQQHSLAVNAVTVEGNETLHAWMIIDPQSTNASSTTYKVYATDRYQNFTFDHWRDNGSTDRFRTITISDNATLTAYYKSEISHPTLKGKIAFTSDKDGIFKIYTIDSDGTNQIALEGNSAHGQDQYPRLSPDGTKIAFSSVGDRWSDIYVMNSDGTELKRLTNSDVSKNSYEPSWSPDGTKIAFSSDRDGGGDIYVMNADGKNVTRLTQDMAGNLNPVWSPDGTKIAFSSFKDDKATEIYVMDSDGHNVKRLTNNVRFYDSFPSWSPDGTKIAFSSTRDGGNYQVYVMNADGTQQTRLTVDGNYDVYPSWSPDGKMIAFLDAERIYTMTADGTNQTGLTPNKFGNENFPDWGR